MADKGGYIGRSPGDSAVIIARQNYSPTGVQTDFTFNSGYTPGYVDVYINGVRLIDVQDYVASTGNTVGLTSYANSGDIVEVIAYKAFNVGNVENATGNFDVGGNLTVSGDTNVSGQTTTKNLHVTGVSTLTGASYLADVTEFVSSGIVTVSNTTDSTSSTTGALLVNGGVGVALSMHVGGNLSVGGTLTYEDVTNVDSVGIVTAAKGFRATAGGVVVTAGVSTFPVVAVSAGTTTKDLLVTGVSTFTGDMEALSGLLAHDQIAAHAGDTNTRIRFPAADTITAETGGSERLRIASDGKVGIATDDPQTSLHVLGGQNGFRLERDAANPGYYEVAITSGTPVGANNHASAYFTLSNTAGDYVWKSSTNERMRLLGDTGRLGIGTDNPSVALHVLSSSTGLKIQRGTQSLTVNANYGGASHCALEFTSALSLFPGGGSEKIRITSAGNIGIGSVVPTGKVDIATGGNAYINLGQDSDNPKVVMFRSTGNASNTHYGAELQFLTGDFAFSNAAAADLGSHSFTERFRIDSSGRVLIGHTATVDTSTYNSKLQVMGTDAHGSSGIFGRFSNDAGSPSVHLTKSRNGTTGSHTIVQDDDVVGNIFWWGSDGSDYEEVARISGQIDGTPGSGDTPGRLTFSTTADGESTATERLRIDSSGKLLLGHTSSNGSANFAPVFQIEGTDSVDSSMSLIRNGANAHPPYLTFGKTRGTSNGADTIVQDGDTIGSIDFWGADGSTAWGQAAKITASIDGTPGSNVTPGKLAFFTTAASAGSATERMRIAADGAVNIGASGDVYDIWNTLATDQNVKLQVRTTVGEPAGIGVLQERGDSNGANIIIGKSRGGSGAGVITSGDVLGYLKFSGADGTRQHNAAGIGVWNSGTVATGRVAGNMSFYTAPDSVSEMLERLRIASTGTVTVNSGNGASNATVVLSKADAGVAKLEFDVGTSQKAYVELDASEDLVHYGAANVAQYFYAGGSERLRITDAGNILVSGTFQVNNFQILDGGWTTNWDTGISVNQSNAGACLIFMNCSNWDANDSTAAGIYIVRLGYSGNQDPQVWHISGNNSWTITKSGSNTVLISNASGNQRSAILWTT